MTRRNAINALARLSPESPINIEETSGEDGRFQIRHVVPGAKYHLQIIIDQAGRRLGLKRPNTAARSSCMSWPSRRVKFWIWETCESCRRNCVATAELARCLCTILGGQASWRAECQWRPGAGTRPLGNHEMPFSRAKDVASSRYRAASLSRRAEDRNMTLSRSNYPRRYAFPIERLRSYRTSVSPSLVIAMLGIAATALSSFACSTQAPAQSPASGAERRQCPGCGSNRLGRPGSGGNPHAARSAPRRHPGREEGRGQARGRVGASGGRQGTSRIRWGRSRASWSASSSGRHS